ncbi:hypothetical protein ACFOSB_13125 [Deinococcus rufus]|uniref:Uncharacterized protein n=1 Tax=Deinococcus rufus TaxID=2136097 RepID=A0ABV7ZBT9_9DEIO
MTETNDSRSHTPLGHLCDFRDLPNPDKAVKSCQIFLEARLPTHQISGGWENGPGNEYDYICQPPLALEEAVTLEQDVRAWARDQGFDFCTCYLESHIRTLGEVQENE